MVTRGWGVAAMLTGIPTVILFAMLLACSVLCGPPPTSAGLASPPSARPEPFLLRQPHSCQLWPRLCSVDRLEAPPWV